jgi:NAD(P)-dependent dehydrogenase (short-subunit alcohol dehydrogenase family)
MPDAPALPAVLSRFLLTDKVTVVTGWGSGIGREIALAFADAGADVVGLELIEELGLETAREVANRGRRALPLCCDVSDPERVTDAFATVDAEFGRIDVLVNCAFKGSHAHPADLAFDEWKGVLDVGVTAYFLCAQQAGRRMIAQKRPGVIINLSSIAGLSALGRGNFAYSVGKGAVNQLTRELAIEWAPYGIRVNAILPCQVRTPALQHLIDDPQFDSDTLVGTFLHGIPLGRLAETPDIANAALFLASDAASMITGILLPVDGGNLAMNAGGTVRW